MGGKKRTRIGIVGCGHAAIEFHFPAMPGRASLRRSSRPTPYEERRKSVEERFCLRTYADFRDMLDVEELDVVSLLVPPHVMEEMCGEVAGRGKPILCEKPLGEDIKTAERIAEVVARSGVALPVVL